MRARQGHSFPELDSSSAFEEVEYWELDCDALRHGTYDEDIGSTLFFDRASLKRLAETPLLAEAFAAERMCTQPTRANKHNEINLQDLGDAKLKR